jgi:hypothetical protein
MSSRKRLDAIFSLTAARSAGIDSYESGSVPFVTSAEDNNGVVGYVKPLDGDLVFEGPSIAISGLGHATVHLRQFLPKGNGGDSLTVLTPRSPRRVEELVAAAAAFNATHKWRFSFGRKCSVGRLEQLELEWPLPSVAPTWRNETAVLKHLQDIVSVCLDSPTTRAATERDN